MISFLLESTYGILPYGGTLCKDNGKQEVTTLKECKIVTKEMNFNGRPTTEDNPFYPRGCYVYGNSEPLVYFNFHSTGSAHESSRPICKTSGKFQKLRYNMAYNVRQMLDCVKCQ